jgi:uncharacterized peroxidase-related enzyme
MAWIQVIDEANADGSLQALYSEIRAKRGKVAEIVKVHSLNPAAMKAHLDLYVTLMFGSSSVSREEREMIATAVSAGNGCDYCVRHHSEALDSYWKDAARVRAFSEDPFSVDLSDRLRALISFALKLTREPSSIEPGDLETLRRAGVSDEGILSISLIAAYFNFVNRVALGLGVSPTPEESSGYKY